MNLLVLLLVLALIFGGVGLFVTGLKWMLIVSAFLFVASLFTGATNRHLGAWPGTSTSTGEAPVRWISLHDCSSRRLSPLVGCESRLAR